MVGFQVPLVDALTEEQLLERFFPQLTRNEGPGSHAGVVTIMNSTTDEPREASVRVSTDAGILHGRPYAEMERPWVRVGVDVYDLLGVLPYDYMPLAIEILRKLLQSEEFDRGLFTICEEATPPFLTWSPEGVVVHQYHSETCQSDSPWQSCACSHVPLADAALPMLDEMGIEYSIERAPISSTY